MINPALSTRISPRFLSHSGRRLVLRSTILRPLYFLYFQRLLNKAQSFEAVQFRLPVALEV